MGVHSLQDSDDDSSEDEGLPPPPPPPASSRPGGLSGISSSSGQAVAAAAPPPGRWRSHALPGAVTPAPPRRRAARCSYRESGENFIEQHWYYCYTCGLTESKGCCSTCAVVCHAGHDVVYSGRSRFFCDCGAGVPRCPPCKCLDEVTLPPAGGAAGGGRAPLTLNQSVVMRPSARWVCVCVCVCGWLCVCVCGCV